MEGTDFTTVGRARLLREGGKSRLSLLGWDSGRCRESLRTALDRWIMDVINKGWLVAATAGACGPCLLQPGKRLVGQQSQPVARVRHEKPWRMRLRVFCVGGWHAASLRRTFPTRRPLVTVPVSLVTLLRIPTAAEAGMNESSSRRSAESNADAACIT